MLHRFAIALLALLIGVAAPARAWCEASCVAPAAPSQSATPHCPTHEPAGGTAVSASDLEACPVIESARPTMAARIDLQATLVAQFVPGPASRTFPATAISSRHNAATVHQRSTPLRI